MNTRIRSLLILAFGITVCKPVLSAEVHFVARSLVDNLSHQYTGGWEFFVGGGVATMDCNNDSYQDLFVAGGDSSSRLLLNKTEQSGAPIRLQWLRQEATEITGVSGAYPLDIDGDGILDLVVLRVGSNILLQGMGDCQFTEKHPWKFRNEDAWTTAFSATFEFGSDGPTLVFGNYVDRSNPDGPFGTCSDHSLHRFRAGQFGPAEKLVPGHCTLSILFSDWSRSGKADLRISNDRHYYLADGREQLWHIGHKSLLYKESEGWQTLKIWGMGITSRDITGDGYPEYFLTSMGDQKLRSLKDGPTNPHFHDLAFKRGVTAHRPYIGDDGRPSTGWHAEFFDANNDGYSDLFIAKGNVDQMPDAATADPNNLLIQQPSGRFLEQGSQAGIASPERSRGASLTDFNNDGLIDIAVINRRADMEILENTTINSGNWVSFETRQDPPNTHAIGAWLEVRTKRGISYREIIAGGGHASGSAAPQHFGLGPYDEVQVRVRWPDQSVGQWQSLAANRLHRLDKP